MLEPLIYVDIHRIKHGHAGACLQTSREHIRTLEGASTRHLYFAICLNEQNLEYANVQIHPDAESMVAHNQLAGRQARAAAETLESRIESHLYGIPDAALRGQLDQNETRISGPSMGFSDLMPAEQWAPVSGPLIFILSYGLMPGSGRAHETVMDGVVRSQEAPPSLLHDRVYLDESGGRVTNVQVYKGVKSAAARAGLLYWQRLAALKTLIDSDSMRISIVGAGGEAVRDKLRGLLGPTVPIEVRTPALGFSRLALE